MGVAQRTQAAGRVRLVALNVGANRREQCGIGQVHGRAATRQHPLRLIIQPLALRLILRRAGIRQHLVERRIAVL